MKPVSIKVGSVSVSIYEVSNNGYKSYRITYYQAGVRKMIRKSSIEEAKREARRIAETLHSPESAVVRKSKVELWSLIERELSKRSLDLNWVINDFLPAFDRVKELSWNSLTEAISSLGNERLTTGKPHVNIGEAVDEFFVSKEREGASKYYLADIKMRTRHFKEYFQVDLLALKAPQINKWLSNLEVTNRSRNNYRLLLGTFFNWCKHKGYLPQDWREHENLQRFRAKDEESVSILTPEQMGKVLKAASERWPGMLAYLALAAFAGVRQAEITRLTWDAIDLKRGFIVVGKDKSKTNKRRLVPIEPNLLPWLVEYQGKGPVCSYKNLSNQIGRICTVAGVEWSKNAPRHSYISYRLALIHDANKIALESGNSPAMIFSNYKELVTPEEGKKWFSITPSTVPKSLLQPGKST